VRTHLLWFWAGKFLTLGAELWDFNTLIELCWISRVPPAVDVAGRDSASQPERKSGEN
jgi:hypothetical protein